MAAFEAESRPPLITGRTWDDYYTNLSGRVHEEDMRTDANYSLLAQIIFSQYGEIGEFQARLARIGGNEMGRTSLILCLIDPETDDAMAYLDSTVEDGIITPNSRRRITHNRVQGIGTIETGYLLGPAADLTALSQREPKDLTAGAYADNPDTASSIYFSDADTRTRALELHGIILGSD